MTKIPEIDANIISKEEAFWVDFRDRIKRQIENLEKELKVNKAILETAEKKLEEERKADPLSALRTENQNDKI